MSSYRPFLSAVLLIAAAVASGDELRVVPASPETKTSAAAALLAALTSNDTRVLENMLQPPVLCGPRLWQQLKASMPNDKARVGTATLIFDTASARESWEIRPLDLRTVSDDVRKALQVIIESQPGRIPVESGVFRGTGVEVLAVALRERYLRGEISVSQATTENLRYYWLMIPYDIEEPVLRIDTEQSSLLVDVEADGRVTWIDLLPEDIARPERAGATR